MNEGFFGRFGQFLVAESGEELRRHLVQIDLSLHDREAAGASQVERHVLGMYLRLLLQEDRLSFPLTLTKRESPGFSWQEEDRIWGLEIVEGRSEGRQRTSPEPAATASPPRSQPKLRDKGAPPGDQPLPDEDWEAKWADALADRVLRKTRQLQAYGVDLRNRCDLLIWDNTEWAGFTGWQADLLPGRLARNIADRLEDIPSGQARFRRISVVREQLALHDVTAKGLVALHDVTNEAVVLVSSRAASQLHISHDRIARFCRKHGIRKLGFFGSIHEPDHFGPESDVDVLVEFQPETKIGLIAVAGLEIELSELIGRKVDLLSVPELSKYFREQVTRQKTELEYVALAG